MYTQLNNEKIYEYENAIAIFLTLKLTQIAFVYTQKQCAENVTITVLKFYFFFFFFIFYLSRETTPKHLVDIGISVPRKYKDLIKLWKFVMRAHETIVYNESKGGMKQDELKMRNLD